MLQCRLLLQVGYQFFIFLPEHGTGDIEQIPPFFNGRRRLEGDLLLKTGVVADLFFPEEPKLLRRAPPGARTAAGCIT